MLTAAQDSQQEHYGMSTVKIAIKIALKGHMGLFPKEIRRRVYSDNNFVIWRRNVSVCQEIRDAKISLTLRSLKREDIPRLLNFHFRGLSDKEIMERLRLLRLLKSGIQRCYVAVTDNNVPCHMGWLIDSRENSKLRQLFGGGILDLASDEVLFEGGFTPEQYRGQGIQRWIVAKFVEMARDSGAKSALSYVRYSNIPSHKAHKGNLFSMYMLRKDKWRFFLHSMTFAELSDGIEYPPGV